MRALLARASLWLLAACACLVADVALLDATRMPLALGTEVALGTFAFVIAGAFSQGAAHTRSRWRTLDVLRVFALFSGLGAAAWIAGGLFLGVPWRAPLLQVALVGPAFAAALCILGAVLEIEPRRQRAKARVAKKLYETASGAVYEVISPRGRETVVMGPSGQEGIDKVQRAIDARGWRDAEAPRADEFQSALERWGHVLRSDRK